MRIPSLAHELWFKFSAETITKFEVRLPNAEQLAKYRRDFQKKGTGQFMYVKLHGSYGWSSHDGSDVMVIGEGKRGRIEREPLLKWFLSIFEEVLHAGDRNLVVIGYGFGDDHVNEIIASAIKDSGLRLHVISPMEPEHFKNRLIDVHGNNVKPIRCGQEIWSGICGYYPNKVTDFYTAHSPSIWPSRGRQFIKNLRLG